MIRLVEAPTPCTFTTQQDVAVMLDIPCSRIEAVTHSNGLVEPSTCQLKSRLIEFESAFRPTPWAQGSRASSRLRFACDIMTGCEECRSSCCLVPKWDSATVSCKRRRTYEGDAKGRSSTSKTQVVTGRRKMAPNSGFYSFCRNT